MDEKIKKSWLYRFCIKVLLKACKLNIKREKKLIDKLNILLLQDEQWVLDYLDELNKLSIDRDRPDSKK